MLQWPTTQKVQHADGTSSSGDAGQSGSKSPVLSMPAASVVSRQIHDLVLPSRLKDGEVIGVVDEDAPEEPRRQDTVEPLYKGILLGASEPEEEHAR